MNKKLTILTAALALLAFLAIPIGVWGQTRDGYSYTFTAKVFDANNQTKTLNEVDWAFAGTLGGSSAFFGYDGTKGQQFGSGSNPFSSFTLSTSDIDGTITEIIVNTSGASSIAGTLNVTVGGNAFGDEYTLTKDATDVTFTGSASGEIVFNYAQSSSKAFYIKSISITYTTGGGSDPEIQIAADELQLPSTANSSGSFNVTYTNDFEPYVAFAALYNDAQGEEEFDGDWIELVEESLSDFSLIEYEVQANTGTSVRTVYLYVEAMDADQNIIDAMFTITQAAQPTYTVTYAPNGGSGTMTDPDSPYHAGDVVALLASTFTAPEGMIWDSWQVKDADNNDVTVSEGSFIMPASNVTVTAQWADPSGTEYEWVLTPLANLTENDVFVIVGKRDNNDNYYAMSNDNGTSTQPAAVLVTFTGEKLANAPANNIKWQFSGDNTDGYTFYPNGNGSAWLYCNTTAASGSNTNMRVGTGDRKLFVLDNNNYLVTKDSYTARYVSLNNDVDWRGYVNTNQATTITFYKRQVAGTPNILASDVNIEYNVTDGAIGFTIENPVQNGSISISSESDWLDVSNQDPQVSIQGTFAFTCDANTENTARTATVTLTYTYGTPAQSIDKNVTVTQAGDPNFTTIPALFAAATGTATNVMVEFGGWVVSGVSTNGKNVFVTDNNGNGFVIYSSSSLAETYAVGNTLTGTTECSLKLNQGYAQLQNVDATELTIEDGGTVTEQDIVLADLAGVNTGALVSYEELTCSIDDSGNTPKYYLSDGTTTLQVYNSLYADAYTTLEAGKTYDITGIYQQYGNTKEILPRSADDIAEHVSPIFVENATVEVAGEGGAGLLTVLYTGVDPYYAEVHYFDENGEPAEAPLWLNAGLDTDYCLTYAIGPNDGDARSAYLKIYVDGVYSNLVTITQLAFVADYAVLPFQYSDDDVSTYGLEGMPNGLTQTGLGTYPNSTPRLKFDTTDDELVLKVEPNEYDQRGPLAITFDIKGNSFSGGTFTVKMSEDGVDYEDIAVYTDAIITGTTKTFTLLNTNENVRYFKWVYTDRQGGNVALGNIYVDDTYEIRGMATVAGDITLDHCYIEPTGVLTIEGSLEVTEANGLSNGGNRTNLIIKDGAQLKTPNAVFATVEKNITGYTAANVNTNKGYYLISAPAKTNLFVAQDNDDVDAYHFDASEEGAEWRNFKLADGAWHIAANNAVLYATKENSTLSLDGYSIVSGNTVYNEVPATNEPVDVDVRFNSGKVFEGFNLIGNPFTCTAYLVDGRDFYRMNGDRNEIVLAEESAIGVCEGIFVVTTTSETMVTFTTTVPTGVAPSAVNISMSQAQTRGEAKSIDAARIRFGEGQMLPKFYFMGNNSGLCIPQGDKEYAVVRSNGQGEMPVNFKAAENGTYTISVNAENIEMDYMHLIDNMTGADIDLLATPSYTFEARTSDYASRFRLVFSANNVATEGNDSFAYFNGSEWVVNASENATLQIVDMMGRIVLNTTGINSISTNGMAEGVYVLRLVNGTDVKTQKIVVR